MRPEPAIESLRAQIEKIEVRGRIQREGEVVHLVAQKVADLSAEPSSVDSRDVAFPLPHGRGDQARHSGGPDPRERAPKGLRARDFFDPYGHIDEIKMKTRDFR